MSVLVQCFRCVCSIIRAASLRVKHPTTKIHVIYGPDRKARDTQHDGRVLSTGLWLIENRVLGKGPGNAETVLREMAVHAMGTYNAGKAN